MMRLEAGDGYLLTAEALQRDTIDNLLAKREDIRECVREGKIRLARRYPCGAVEFTILERSIDFEPCKPRPGIAYM
jgi:hypothetical protein